MPSIDSFYRLFLIPGLEHCFNRVSEINVGQYLHHYRSDDLSQMFCSRLSTGLKMEPRLRRLPDYQMDQDESALPLSTEKYMEWEGVYMQVEVWKTLAKVSVSL